MEMGMFYCVKVWGGLGFLWIQFVSHFSPTEVYLFPLAVEIYLLVPRPMWVIWRSLFTHLRCIWHETCAWNCNSCWIIWKSCVHENDPFSMKVLCKWRWPVQQVEVFSWNCGTLPCGLNGGPAWNIAILNNLISKSVNIRLFSTVHLGSAVHGKPPHSL